jgi:hypothetical protein
VTSGPKWKPALNALPSPSATGSRPPRPTKPTAGNTVGARDRPAAAGSGSCGPAALHIRGIMALLEPLCRPPCVSGFDPFSPFHGSSGVTRSGP